MKSLLFARGYSQIVKLGSQTELFINQRYIKKQYEKYPKQIKELPGTLEDLYFKFHCRANSLSFDEKLNIVQNMVAKTADAKKLDLYGIQSIIASLVTDLKSLAYSDTDEYNISQLINILHKIHYYDTPSWITAMDNYHKQGVLNWVQFQEFTHAVYDFSFKLTEDWHLNIVKDISQEAWADFVGFVENKFALDLPDAEILKAYTHLRKFSVRANKTHVLSVIQYFMHNLSDKSVKTISHETYQFLLSFTLDHASFKELHQPIVSLFMNLLKHLFEDTQGFAELRKVVTNYDQYYQLLTVLITLRIYSYLTPEIRVPLQERLQQIALAGQLEEECYQSIQKLVQLKKLLLEDKGQFFEQSQDIIKMIDDLCLENLKNITKRKQNLASIVDVFGLLEKKDGFLSVIAKNNLNLSHVDFSNQELISFFKQLDETDLVYYLPDFLDSALTYIAENINNFQADDWCFAFYLVYKYLVKDDPDPSRFDARLSILKQYIKLHYMTNYRRALPVNSSFYKILSVVELETFYAEDLINYY